MGNTESIDAARRELWEEKLYDDVMATMFFTENNMMGEDENNVIQVKSGLNKSKGDTVTFELTTRMSGNGVDGDDELEGNEEAISAYSESISINQKRFGVRLKGALDEQKNSYNMREDAKNKLKIRLQEFMELQFFLKLTGVNNTTVTDINGVVVGTDCAWSNTPDYYPDADTAAGYGARYLCADYTNGADSLAATDLLTPALISRARVKARTANPKIVPLKVDGKNYFVMFIHEWQAYDLKQNATYAQAQREAAERGKNNPIFTGALGVWDNVIIHTHENVQFLDISVALHSWRGTATGTDYSAVDAFGAILCGRQAIGMVKCNYKKGWVEKSFDYENKTGFATGFMGGIQKIMFNSKEYGCILVDTAATALV